MERLNRVKVKPKLIRLLILLDGVMKWSTGDERPGDQLVKVKGCIETAASFIHKHVLLSHLDKTTAACCLSQSFKSCRIRRFFQSVS